MNTLKINIEKRHMLNSVSRNEMNVLLELVSMSMKNTDKEPIVYLNSDSRENILNSINIKKSSLGNALSMLVKKEVLIKLSSNVYTFNKELFELN